MQVGDVGHLSKFSFKGSLSLKKSKTLKNDRGFLFFWENGALQDVANGLK